MATDFIVAILNAYGAGPHLLRKAQGLCESYTASSQTYGKQVHDILDNLIGAVYQAREGPDKGEVSISDHHKKQLDNLRTICEKMPVSSHKKTGELGREFLNDWEAILRVLECPALPLTNNEAERALRHWVILRKITQGTRSEQGSRALALFASVFATCRLRESSPLIYIRDVINLRRKGKAVPKLPQIPAWLLLNLHRGLERLPFLSFINAPSLRSLERFLYKLVYLIN